MILFNTDLLFIHNPKTAGTTVLDFLSRHLQGPVFRAGVDEIGTHHPHLAMALGYACAKTGNRPQDFNVILSLIRDPYDRELSMYTYFRDVLAGSPGLGQDLNDPIMVGNVKAAAEMPFADFIVWLNEAYGTCDIWNSRYYYEMEGGEIPSNLVVVPVEELETRLPDVLGMLPERPPAVSRVLGRLNAATRHAGAYDEVSSAIVTQSYAWQFERFDYRSRA